MEDWLRPRMDCLKYVLTNFSRPNLFNYLITLWCKFRYLHLAEKQVFPLYLQPVPISSADPACSEPCCGFPPNPTPPRPAGLLLFPLSSLLPKLLFNSLHFQRWSWLFYFVSGGRGPCWLRSCLGAAALALHKEHWAPPCAAPVVCPLPSWS